MAQWLPTGQETRPVRRILLDGERFSQCILVVLNHFNTVVGYVSITTSETLLAQG